MSSSLEIDIAGIRATTPRKNKTFESTVFLAPQAGFSPRQNKTFESTLFKDPHNVVVESPSRPAKKFCENSPKPSMGSVLNSDKKERDNNEQAGIAYQTLSNSTSKIWSKSSNRTFQSSLFEDDDASSSAPRSAKKLINSGRKTNIENVFERESNQENNASESNIRRPSKRAFADQTTVQKVFEENQPIKSRPAKKLSDSNDKSSMNLVISHQAKSDYSPRARGSSGRPSLISLS